MAENDQNRANPNEPKKTVTVSHRTIGIGIGTIIFIGLAILWGAYGFPPFGTPTGYQAAALKQQEQMLGMFQKLVEKINAPAAANQPAAPAKVQAIEVEVIPLAARKVATHAHVLHGQKCIGNEGEKVKVRITGANGRMGWDWYTCPQTT